MDRSRSRLAARWLADHPTRVRNGATTVYLLSLLGGGLAGPAHAADLLEPPAPPTTTVNLEGAFNWGKLRGFMQVPEGGQPGTSSPQRPTFDELGIHDTTFYDVALDVRWRQLDFFAGAQFIGFDSSGTLTAPLVSHGVRFAAGDPFETQDRFDWYGLGLGWRFDLLEKRLVLTPKIEGALLDFSYDLSSGAAAAQRSYTKGCVRLGIGADYRWARVISFQLEGAASIPISNTPQIAALVATARFDLLPSSRTVKPALFLGGGWEWIDYEDNQTLPNHIRADLGPFLSAGFSVAF
jgi:hypothetical protein